MSARNHVHDALRRWQRVGLIDGTLADRLRTETDAHAATEGRRWAQYAVATTGAVILVIAASVFLRWAWPLMGPGSRSMLLAVVGIITMLLGLLLESRRRLAPAEYLLHAASLAILLMAFAYSRRAWDDSSLGAIVFGLGILTVPLVTAGVAIRRRPVMPAIHAAFGYAFLYLFVERATTLDGLTVLWIVDGVAALSVLLLALRLRDAEHRDADDWTLNAFTASLYAAGVLMFFTAAGQLDEYRSAVWALDVWLLAVAILTLWGIHAAPIGLRRTWFGKQLTFCILLAIVFGWWTALGALRLDDAPASLVVASIGAVGLYYGLRFDARDAIVASCIALLSAAWYFGTQAGGAIGAMLALAFSAALFFWISTRLSRDPLQSYGHDELDVLPDVARDEHAPVSASPSFDVAFRDRLAELIRWRRDVRRFRTDPVAPELIDHLLALADQAPSVGLSQPWRFVAMASPDQRAPVIASFQRCNAEALDSFEDETRARYARLKLEGLREAPVQFAVFADEATTKGKGLGRRTMGETVRYSVVCAVHTLWLAARAFGLGVGWVSILDPEDVRRAAGAPSEWALVAYLCIGWPREEHLDPELEREGWEHREPVRRRVV